MKFAQNRLYIESYSKCPNCGVLLYDEPATDSPPTVVAEGRTYCSAWCVSWAADRVKRRNGAGR